MRGRAALRRDEGEHLVEVEQSGVGRGEVLRHEHEGVSGIRDAGGRDAPQARDDALGDVVEVGGALAEISAEGDELLAERGEGVVHGELAGLAGGEAAVDLGLEGRVLGDHRLRLEHVAGGAARLRAAGLELARDGADGLAHARRLLVDRELALGILRGGQGLGHARDGSLGDAQSDSDSTEFRHGVCLPYSASWSVVSSSARRSSVGSALSPSAVRVT